MDRSASTAVADAAQPPHHHPILSLRSPGMVGPAVRRSRPIAHTTPQYILGRDVGHLVFIDVLDNLLAEPAKEALLHIRRRGLTLSPHISLTSRGYIVGPK